MVYVKRIKNKEDLVDVLSFIIEDVSTFKFLKNHIEVVNVISKAKEMVK